MNPMKRIAGSWIAGLLVLVAPAGAMGVDRLYPPELFSPQPMVQFDVGVGYWYSVGKAKKTLYDGGGTQLSRLGWSDQIGHAGEAYFNVTQSSVFAKGYIGVGGRYWHMEAPNGTAHFEVSTINGGPQVEKFESDRYGAFVQPGYQC